MKPITISSVYRKKDKYLIILSDKSEILVDRTAKLDYAFSVGNWKEFEKERNK